MSPPLPMSLKRPSPDDEVPPSTSASANQMNDSPHHLYQNQQDHAPIQTTITTTHPHNPNPNPIHSNNRNADSAPNPSPGLGPVEVDGQSRNEEDIQIQSQIQSQSQTQTQGYKKRKLLNGSSLALPPPLPSSAPTSNTNMSSTSNSTPSPSSDPAQSHNHHTAYANGQPASSFSSYIPYPFSGGLRKVKSLGRGWLGLGMFGAGNGGGGAGAGAGAVGGGDSGSASGSGTGTTYGAKSSESSQTGVGSTPGLGWELVNGNGGGVGAGDTGVDVSSGMEMDMEDVIDVGSGLGMGKGEEGEDQRNSLLPPQNQTSSSTSQINISGINSVPHPLPLPPQTNNSDSSVMIDTTTILPSTSSSNTDPPTFPLPLPTANSTTAATTEEPVYPEMRQLPASHSSMGSVPLPLPLPLPLGMPITVGSGEGIGGGNGSGHGGAAAEGTAEGGGSAIGMGRGDGDDEMGSHLEEGSGKGLERDQDQDQYGEVREGDEVKDRDSGREGGGDEDEGGDEDGNDSGSQGRLGGSSSGSNSGSGSGTRSKSESGSRSSSQQSGSESDLGSDNGDFPAELRVFAARSQQRYGGEHPVKLLNGNDGLEHGWGEDELEGEGEGDDGLGSGSGSGSKAEEEEVEGEDDVAGSEEDVMDEEEEEGQVALGSTTPFGTPAQHLPYHQYHHPSTQTQTQYAYPAEQQPRSLNPQVNLIYPTLPDLAANEPFPVPTLVGSVQPNPFLYQSELGRNAVAGPSTAVAAGGDRGGDEGDEILSDGDGEGKRGYGSGEEGEYGYQEDEEEGEYEGYLNDQGGEGEDEYYQDQDQDQEQDQKQPYPPNQATAMNNGFGNGEVIEVLDDSDEDDDDDKPIPVVDLRDDSPNTSAPNSSRLPHQHQLNTSTSQTQLGDSTFSRFSTRSLKHSISINALPPLRPSSRFGKKKISGGAGAAGRRPIESKSLRPNTKKLQQARAWRAREMIQQENLMRFQHDARSQHEQEEQMSEYSKKAYEGSKELINQAQILRNLNLGRSAPGRLGKSQGLATSVRRVRDMPLRPAKQERKPIGAAVLEKQYRDLAASLGMGLGIGAGSLSKSLSGPQLPTSPTLTEKKTTDTFGSKINSGMKQYREPLKKSLRPRRDVINDAKPPPPPHPLRVQLELAKQDREQDELALQTLKGLNLQPPEPFRIPDLDDDEEDQVTAWLSGQPFSSKCDRAEVELKDIVLLRPRKWLNDEVINFYVTMMQQRADADIGEDGEPRRKIHGFNSFFYPKLAVDYAKSKVARWTKKVDIFAKDIVIFPINLNGTHWVCGAINLKDKRFEYYDSMNPHGGAIAYKRMREYLQAEHLDKKKKPLDLSDWENYVADHSPQQSNSYDCGVFVCQTLEHRARGVGDKGDDNPAGAWEFEQQDMDGVRRLMVWEIGKSKLKARGANA